jgi:hypothetical protein
VRDAIEREIREKGGGVDDSLTDVHFVELGMERACWEGGKGGAAIVPSQDRSWPRVAQLS